MKNRRCSQNAQGWGLGAGGNCPEPRAQSPARGFSLIEVLIGSVIVASALALLAGSLIATNRSATLRRDGILATQLLASRLAELDERVASRTPASGTFPSPLEGFSWTMELSKAQPPLAPLTMTTLTVEHEGRATHVVTYRRVIE